MGSPKHLWSGDWQEESAAARGSGRPLPTRETAAQTAAPRPAPSRPEPPRSTPPSAPRPRRARPRRRLTWPREWRRWAAVGAIALIAGFIATTAVTVLARDDSHPTTTATAGPGWIGVRVRSWPGGGALIERVTPGGPADAAGLDNGDLIVAIDTTSVNSAADVTTALQHLHAGQVVPVRALRGPTDFTAQVAVAGRPAGSSTP